MTKAIMRCMLGALLCASLAACAGESPALTKLPAEPGSNLVAGSNPVPVQCAPYARTHSQVDLHGDAYTWWDQAAGRFARGARPLVGAVLMLNDYAGPARAHLGVVRRIVSSREIRIDHANWLDDGSVYINDPVVDVSPAGDWSLVKVWNIPAGGWGAKTYPVQGFIGPDAPGKVPSGSDARIASASS